MVLLKWLYVGYTADKCKKIQFLFMHKKVTWYGIEIETAAERIAQTRPYL